MKEANHLRILFVTRERSGFQMRGMIEGFFGGGRGRCLRFSDSLIFGGGNLTKYFLCECFFNKKVIFFFFLSVCLFLFTCVCVLGGGGGEGEGWGNIIWLWLKPWGYFCPHSITDPGHFKSKRHPSLVPDSISKRSRKKHCFCNCIKERNTFFYGRYVIEGDWKNKGLLTTGATHLNIVG